MPRDAALLAAIVAWVITVFLVDLLTPLGISVWILYSGPVVIAYALWQPAAPLAVAAAAAVLVVATFYLSPPGAEPWLSALNRSFGIGVLFVLAVAGWMLIRGKRAIEREEWLQTRQVAIAERMAGDQSIPQLTDAVLGFLADELGAELGAFFVGDDGVFRRTASFGVPIGAAMPTEVAPGSGLLGQAIKDARGFLVRDLPPDYVIGSSLGRGTPRQLLIAPLKVDGDVQGVIELGFFEAIDDVHRQLLDRAAGPIGMALRSAKYRAKQKELLEETQRQAEELHAQNEELETQAQALEESQTRLEEQQTELEQMNTTLADERTVLERSQAELREKAAELERASRYKSDFLANMSHELRTPLNAALIMARLLAENRAGNLTSEQVRYAETIESSGKDLLNLINDVLDLSKIEAGRLEIRPRKVALSGFLDKIAGTFRPAAEAKRLAFSTRLAPDAPAEIETDPQRLEQVLNNFLSNAIKFTEDGEIAVTVGAAADGAVSFSVRDSGIGIEPAQQDLIFESFQQASGTAERGLGGTGLGLTIARELARLLGGKIRLESAPGAGSTFTLCLPATVDPALDRSAEARAPVSARGPGHAEGKRESPPRQPLIADDREKLSGDSRVVLVVEDDAPFARILCDLAHEQGFQCVVAGTADEGMALARQFLPSAVILDIGLPDHSGLTVLDRLKRNAATRHIPVHVVSVHDHTEMALSEGAAGYLLKPVKREELVAALKGLEDRLRARVRRVLVVEDDPEQRRAIEALLAVDGVEIATAQTGGAALALLGEKAFDCMVLDLSLPDMSGFDLIDRLASDETLQYPPIIVYTGRDLTADEELRLRRTSRSVIVKGAKSPERLLDEVTLFLHHIVAELPPKQQQLLARAMERDAALEGRRILVVEDDVRNIFSLTSILEPRGALLQIARNGREALAALERAADGSAPVDLVLMDVMMPEMDGLAATREIRKRPEWQKLPVIILTAKAMQHDQEQCLAAGANDYMAKPVDVDKLLSLVRVWMPRRKG